ncbi:MAG: glycosyl hydrolase family 95 catalytic domain-containing protein [Phycisphaeraceae bacterium]
MERIDAPTRRHDLELAAPIERWDEAIPLGNGTMGALLWGEGERLRLSLDRADLWDTRTPKGVDPARYNWPALRAAVERGDEEFVHAHFERPFKAVPYPTKLPAGRLELTCDGDRRDVAVERFELELRRAVGRAHLDGGTLEVFCSAVAEVGMARLTGVGAAVELAPPRFDDDTAGPRALGRLDYPPPTIGREAEMQWSHQRCAAGLDYAIVVGCRRAGDETLIAFTVSTNRDGDDPVAIGRQRVAAALEAGFERMIAPHARWWARFWARSAVRVDDEAIERHYYLARYFYGSASRRGAPPMALQGVWTADEGMLPPWSGDYHHDLNTQMSYWPYLTANHLDEGACFLDWLWDRLPAARDFARRFYHTDGACLPATTSLTGAPAGGWAPYSCSPASIAWLGQLFHRHWRYTRDATFLRERAYPWCRELATCIEALLEPDARGRLRLPLSASPEVHGNEPAAWMTPPTNYDQALLLSLFAALREMADALGRADEAAHWADVQHRLGDLAVGAVEAPGGFKGRTLLLAPDESLQESHRHFSHLMAIHPLGLLHIERDSDEREIVQQSLRQLDHLGMALWVGFSFTWMSCLAARAGLAERAVAMLDAFLRTCVSRNGFHLNGDYRGLGMIAAQYRPFTLEGNFAAAEAVHEMLLQSWGGTVRVFPAVPQRWATCGFDDLRAEGALLVSARREGGRTTRVRVSAEVDAEVRLRDPFDGAAAAWNRRDVRRDGGDYLCAVGAGETLEGRLP